MKKREKMFTSQPSSAELLAEIPKKELALKVATSELGELELKLPGALIAGDDEIIDQLKADLADAKEKENDLRAVIDGLPKVASEVKAAETKVELEALTRDAVKAQASGVKVVEEIDRIAPQIAALALQLEGFEADILKARRAHNEAGVPFDVKSIAIRVQRGPHPGSFSGSLVLPDPRSGYADLWPMSDAEKIANDGKHAEAA